MTARIPRKRTKTARETAEHFGVSIRTVQNHIAEPRDEYEATAAYRRELAGRLHAEGKSWGEIAEAVQGTEWAARALVRRSRLAG